MTKIDNDVLQRIQNKREKCSKGQKKLSNYILKNYDKVAFMTALEISKKTGVSESTVVRFAKSLGYKGFPQFQKELANLVKDKLHSIDKISIKDKNVTDDVIIENVFKADSDKILNTINNLDKEAFSSAIDMIMNAKQIYIIGIRDSSILADFLANNLKQIYNNIVKITSTNTSELIEQMISVDSEDVVVGISFPRYSMRTLKAMEYANNKNAGIISITDSKHSPMNMYSSCNLFADSSLVSVMESLVAPLSLINALVVAIYIKKSDELVNRFEKLQEIYENYAFKGNDEINMIDENLLEDLRGLDE